jgi:hypothetical protein
MSPKKPRPTEFTPVNEVKQARAARKKRAAFYTPLSLVAKLVEWAEVSSHCRTLEPSAGDGRIVHALREAGVPVVDACETEEPLHELIRAAGGTVVGTDFFKYKPETPYHRIVMNPPFRGREYERHIEHAWSMLAPGGLLVSIAPAPVRDAVRDLKLNLPGCIYATCELVSPNSFNDFDTSIPTAVVELHRQPNCPASVCGFSNQATHNAALTVESDYNFVTAARRLHGKFTDVLIREVSKEIIDCGGSCYGIDWKEVGEYLTQA